MEAPGFCMQKIYASATDSQDLQENRTAVDSPTCSENLSAHFLIKLPTPYLGLLFKKKEKEKNPPRRRVTTPDILPCMSSGVLGFNLMISEVILSSFRCFLARARDHRAPLRILTDIPWGVFRLKKGGPENLETLG